MFPLALEVQGLGHQAFAGTALPVDGHVGVHVAEFLDHLEHPLHGRADPHQLFRLGLGPKPFVQVGHAVVEGPEFQGLLDMDLKLLQVQGFGQVHKGAPLHGAYRRTDAAMGGHHDHRHPGVQAADLLQ